MFISMGSPPLSSGVTIALFQAGGREHVERERLNKSQRGYIRICEADLRSFVSIPSGPKPQLSFSSLMV